MRGVPAGACGRCRLTASRACARNRASYPRWNTRRRSTGANASTSAVSRAQSSAGQAVSSPADQPNTWANWKSGNARSRTVPVSAGGACLVSSARSPASGPR